MFKKHEKVVMFFALVVILFMVGALAYSLTDKVGQVKKSSGTVVGRINNASQVTFVPSGNMTATMISQGEWELCIRIEDVSRIACHGVPESRYYLIPDGLKVDILYTIGKWSNKIYLKSIVFPQ
jgi:hypothetical protein